MAASQFTVYDWGDPGAPTLDGTSGSMIRVLDGCLINGYGSKPAAGWLQPIPTVSASWGYMACFMQPSGSGCTLMINDSPPTGSLTGSGIPPGSQINGTMTAWATGWEFLLGFTGSVTGNTSSLQNGSGSGQFPQPGSSNLIGALLTSGSVEWTKSKSIGSQEQRPWRMFADAYTMYLFVGHHTLDEFSYSLYAFGDLYSFKPTPDRYKCMIMGKLNQVVSAGPQQDPSDFTLTPTSTIAPFYIQRTYTGTPGAISSNKVGDAGKCNIGGGSTNYCTLQGLVRNTGQTENVSHFSPLLATDGTIAFRGRLRGLFTPLHHYTTLQDGMIISGSNHYNGKIFQIVKRGPSNGVWAVEISNTVETNDN